MKATNPQPDEAEPTRPPASAKARAMRAKLQELVTRGVNGEKAAAGGKLRRLEAKWDFESEDPTETRDLFAGAFEPAALPALVATLGDYETANAVKWAIEHATPIHCTFHGLNLHAYCTDQTAGRLKSIAETVAGGFADLWRRFQNAQGVTPQDRQLFYLGLYEGMMREERPGERLPTRAVGKVKKVRASRKAIVRAPAVGLHPYSVAATLGRRLRMCAPLPDVIHELESKIRGELEAA